MLNTFIGCEDYKITGDLSFTGLKHKSKVFYTSFISDLLNNIAPELSSLIKDTWKEPDGCGSYWTGLYDPRSIRPRNGDFSFGIDGMFVVREDLSDYKDFDTVKDEVTEAVLKGVEKTLVYYPDIMYEGLDLQLDLQSKESVLESLFSDEIDNER